CMNCMRQIDEGVEKCPHCGFDKNAVVQENLHVLKPYTILQGKYLVGNVMGEGGFGITYIGFDLNLEIRIAIKEFYPNGFVTRETNATSSVTNYTTSDNSQYVKWKESFVKEARSLAKFSNLPGIVHVRDFFQENNTAYIVMEYVEGETLKSYLKSHGGKIAAPEVIEMMRPVIRSLAKVHEAGIIHRDISPDNIMIEKAGALKLIDFGAARDFASEGEKSLSVMLKPGFAPEEQYRSKGDQGPWTDVYAMCATIYRCITGEKPPESMERMRQDTIKKPSAFGVSVSSAQEKAIMDGLAVFAEKRIRSMGELEERLYQGQNGHITNTAGNVSTGIKTAVKTGSGTTNKTLIIILASAAALLLGVIILIVVLAGRKTDSTASLPAAGDRLAETGTQDLSWLREEVSPSEKADSDDRERRPGTNDEMNPGISREPAGSETDTDEWEDDTYYEPEPEEPAYEEETSEFIVPDIDTVYYDRYFFEQFSDEELRIARNEIYARHGRTFRDQALQEYFNSRSWYVPVYDPDEFDRMQESILNDCEKSNRDIIVEIEKARR
ncbi:MAG: YARHG domain-containing protein, partial [Lachnospiraceae bacterium]|nr:YARHG domain-containing protein [Lachnospiraceae bacterium]